MDKTGQLTADTFGRELVYFRDRYVVDGAFTYHFEHLHLRQNDAPNLVQKVLEGEDAEPEQVAAAMLIIVYQFRNNLFHGSLDRADLLYAAHTRQAALETRPRGVHSR